MNAIIDNVFQGGDRLIRLTCKKLHGDGDDGFRTSPMQPCAVPDERSAAQAGESLCMNIDVGPVCVGNRGCVDGKSAHTEPRRDRSCESSAPARSRTCDEHSHGGAALDLLLYP